VRRTNRLTVICDLEQPDHLGPAVDPYQPYTKTKPCVRRMLNQYFFTKPFIDEVPPKEPTSKGIRAIRAEHAEPYSVFHNSVNVTIAEEWSKGASQPRKEENGLLTRSFHPSNVYTCPIKGG
jgi:hypothetical protein